MKIQECNETKHAKGHQRLNLKVFKNLQPKSFMKNEETEKSSSFKILPLYMCSFRVRSQRPQV